jgi:hypothetical protein
VHDVAAHVAEGHWLELCGRFSHFSTPMLPAPISQPQAPASYCKLATQEMSRRTNFNASAAL